MVYIPEAEYDAWQDQRRRKKREEDADDMIWRAAQSRQPLEDVRPGTELPDLSAGEYRQPALGGMRAPSDDELIAALTEGRRAGWPTTQAPQPEPPPSGFDPWQAAQQVNQGLRENVPGYAGAGDVLGKVGEGLEWEQENVSRPLAEFATRTVEARQPLTPLVGGLIEGGGPGGFYEGLKRGWEQRGEPFPGVKGAAEMIVDPLNLVGAGEVKAGAGLAVKGARALAQPERLRAGLRALDEAARSGGVRRLAPGLGIEDVGKPAEDLALRAQEVPVKPPTAEQEGMFAAGEVKPQMRGPASGEAVRPEDLLGGEQFESAAARAQAEREAAIRAGQAELPAALPAQESAASIIEPARAATRSEQLISEYGDVHEQLQSVQQRLYELQGEVEGLAEVKGTVVRPRWGIGLTDQQLLDIAERNGINPYTSGTVESGLRGWDAMDPETVRDEIVMARGQGKRQGLFGQTAALKGQMGPLRQQEAALQAKLNALGDQAERAVFEEQFPGEVFPERAPVAAATPEAKPAASSTGFGEFFGGGGGALGRSVREADLRKARKSMASARAKYPEMTDAQAAATPLGQQIARYEDELRAIGPVSPATPPAGAAPRKPLWEGQTAGAPPLRRGPPAPPTEPPGELPSGRIPGGAGNVRTPPPPAEPYQQLISSLTPEREGARGTLGKATDRFLRAMYDRAWNAHVIEDATGIPVHKLAQIVPGSISYGEYLAESRVMPVLESVGKDVEYLERYMVGRRYEDLLARNPEARLPGGVEGWPGALQALEGLKAEVGAERYAQLESAAQELWKLNDELVLKPRLDAGLLSKDQYTAIKSANPHYISFYREDFAGLQTGLGKGEANVTSAGIQQMDLAGSTRKLDNPLARFNAQVISTQHLIAENNAAKAIVAGLVEMEKARKATGAATAPLAAGERFAKILGPRDTAEHSRIWDTISYLEDGEKVTAQVPTVYADMAKGLEAESANALSAVLRAASAPLRMGAVTYNPTFVIANPIRDMISAFYREGLQPLSKEYIGGWLAAITKNADYADAAKAGALMSGIVDTMRSTEALARATALGGIRVRNAKDALTLIPNLIQRANLVSEQATRIATYKKLRGQGLGQLDAAIRARDVTVDFAKSGNVMKMVNQFIPFSNAGVQGAANTIRTMRYNPKQAIIGAAPLAMAAILADSWNQRFETAKMIPEQAYTQDWIIVIAEGQKAADPKYPNKPGEKFPIYLRIPKGPLGSVLTAPVEAALRFAKANDDRSVIDHLLTAAQTVATGLSPVEMNPTGLLPPLASTAIGITANYDAFRGQSIVPRREQDRPAELQFGPETSREAVALGERFGLSPRLIDWAIKDVGAGVGGQASWLADVALGALGYNPVPYGAAKAQPRTEVEQLVRTPFVSRFVGTRSSEFQNIGWDKFDKAVEESQRMAAAVPEMRRLGITIGPVSDKASVGEFSIVLTPQERADLQKITARYLVKLAPRVTQNANWQKAPLALQAKVLQALLNDGREVARADYVNKMPKEEIRQRVEESLPVPVGGWR